VKQDCSQAVINQKQMMLSNLALGIARRTAFVSTRSLCTVGNTVITNSIPIPSENIASAKKKKNTGTNRNASKYLDNTKTERGKEKVSEVIGGEEKKEASKSSSSIPLSKPSKQVWPKGNACFVVGFSKFLSRRDLQLILGPHKPITIDPVLNAYHFFIGAYGFSFASPTETEAFKKYISNKSSHTPGKSLLVKTNMAYWENKEYILFNSAQIGHNTLRVDTGNNMLSINHLVTIFESYDVRNQDIRKVHLNRKLSHFLIDFKSIEDARRAKIEFDRFALHSGNILKITAYQC